MTFIVNSPLCEYKFGKTRLHLHYLRKLFRWGKTPKILNQQLHKPSGVKQMIPKDKLFIPNNPRCAYECIYLDASAPV